MSNATRVSRVILFASMLSAFDSAAQTVDGRVVNSATGADLPGVAVNLVRAGEVAYSATTDSKGRFRFDAVEAGIYTANYTARGFSSIPNFLLDEDFERECGRCFLRERGGQPFQVTAVEPVRLDVKLPPLGKISGRVLDDAGAPVPNASLHFYWGDNWLCSMPSCAGISRQTTTNEQGEYNLSDLDVPGAWLVSATAPSSWKPPEPHGDQRLDWAQTFYPGVTSPQLAVKVLVRLGGEISNLDIKLAATPVHRIRGIVLAPDGNPAADASVTLSRAFAAPVLVRRTASDGAFEFGPLAEGEWHVYTKLIQANLKLWAAQSVSLKAHDLENLELRPAAPIAIQGVVVMEVAEGAPAPKAPDVTLAFNPGVPAPPDKPAGAFLTATPTANGDFQIQNVYSGPYQILPGPAAQGHYLDSIRFGSYDALAPNVEIAPGIQPLTITYKPGGGTVRGKVENCASGTVRLLPHGKTMRRPGFMFYAPCDSNDRFEITSVRPGEYYAVAIAGNNPTPWYATAWDDDSLLNTATTVTVRANESSSADLSAINH